LLSGISGVSAHRMRSGTLSPDNRREIVTAADTASRYGLHVIDAGNVSVRLIGAHARRIKRRHGLSMVVVDYLQLVEPFDRHMPREQQVATMARQLKMLAKELKVPILCLAQLNRQVEQQKDNRPKLSHLRESGAIEQDADTVLFVHREEAFRPQDETVRGQAEIIISKQRNGPVGIVPLVFRREVMRFENKAPPRYGALDEFNNQGSDSEF
jgi:replicative DNA helicase